MAKIYTPEDGRRLGLNGMITDVFQRVTPAVRDSSSPPAVPGAQDHGAIARAITLLEGGSGDTEQADDLRRRLTERISSMKSVPVVGLTGTGGAGKSSLTDELLQRILMPPRDSQRITGEEPRRGHRR